VDVDDAMEVCDAGDVVEVAGADEVADDIAIAAGVFTTSACPSLICR
jgi:hypothetical protein